MQTLTRRQKQVYDYIVDFIEGNGYAPSYGEIASGLGLVSKSAIHAHVKNLEKKGYLTTRWSANRSIDITSGHGNVMEASEARLAGRISAGRPIEAVEYQDSIAVPLDMMGRGETYVLEVKGDSMIEDHVMDGDYVVIEKRDHAEEGEMVVALIHGSEATLKRFRRQGSKIRLEPANPVYQPMIFDETEVAIQGIVIGILRKYRR